MPNLVGETDLHIVCNIQVKIYDDDTLTDDDGLGKAAFTLGELMAAPGRSIKEGLKKRSGKKAK